MMIVGSYNNDKLWDCHFSSYRIDILHIFLYNGDIKEMIDMLTVNATDVRNDFSNIIDQAVHQRPLFIKRTRDYLFLSNMATMEGLLSIYHFTAESELEEDGSYTIALNEMDLVENGNTEEEACKELAESILEYAQEFYEEYNLWSKAPNRKKHIPYVLKAIILGDANQIAEEIALCQVE